MVSFPTDNRTTDRKFLAYYSNHWFCSSKFFCNFASSESRQENLVLDVLVEWELLFKNRILNRRLQKKFYTSADTQYFHMLNSTFEGQQGGSEDKSTCSTDLTYTRIKKLNH